MSILGAIAIVCAHQGLGRRAHRRRVSFVGAITNVCAHVGLGLRAHRRRVGANRQSRPRAALSSVSRPDRGRAIRGSRAGVACVIALVSCTHVGRARADRPVHGSVGIGGPLLLTAHDDNRLRAEIELDIEPGSRYGGFIAWRGFDDKAHGMLLGGLIYEAGAARPRLVVDLHADAGADLDQHAPVIGGGLRTVLTIWGPFGIALDSGAYLVIDGVDDTRLRIMGSTSIVVRW